MSRFGFGFLHRLNTQLLTSVANSFWQQEATSNTQVSGTSPSWKGVAWSPTLGLYVAVARTGIATTPIINCVMTSPDGVTWKAGAGAVATTWTSVIWVPELSLFVAVANTATTNAVMTSPDGITWTARTTPSAAYEDICWSPALATLVAVGDAGAVATSPDGVTWTARTAINANNWNGVCWSPSLNLFVASGGTTGSDIATSPDGLTWTTRTTPSTTSAVWNRVIWVSTLSLFVVINGHADTSGIMTSPDGVTWTVRTNPRNSVTAAMQGIAWSPDHGVLVVTCGDGSIIKSSDGITWTSMGVVGGGSGWNSVCYSSALAQFLMVGGGSAGAGQLAAIWKPSGTRVWVDETYTQFQVSGPTTTGSDFGFGAITYADSIGLFVAVGQSASCHIASSPDGKTWTPRTVTLAGNDVYSGVCWSADKALFVAVGQGTATGLIATSPNGITWTRRTAPSNEQWFGVAYSPALGMFVAVTTGGAPSNRFMYSTDGLTWTGGGLTQLTHAYRSITWSPEGALFVAVGASGWTARSADGVTWTEQQIGAGTLAATDIAWVKELGLFVAMANSGTNRLATSPDGVTWTQRNAGAAESVGVARIAWSPDHGMLIAVGSSGGGVYSLDGLNWRALNNFAGRSWTGICYASALKTFAATAQTNATQLCIVLFQPVQAQWPITNYSWQQSASTITSGSQMAWSPSLGIFCLAGTNSVYTSADGKTWTQRTTGITTAGAMQGMAWSPSLGLFVSCGVTSLHMFSSPDGITWTQRTAVSAQIRNICWSPDISLFVAVGTGGTVYTSPDGLTWTSRTSGTTNRLDRVCWSKTNALFCMVSGSQAGSVLFTSPDGITWTARTSGVNNTKTWFNVEWSQDLGLFVAMASGTGDIITSPDGVTWTTSTSPVTTGFQNLVWASEIGLFVAITPTSASATNQVMTSPDGINWTVRSALGKPGNAAQGWNNLAWSPALGMFAVAGDTKAAYWRPVSYRPITSYTWTSRTAPNTSGLWTCACWSPELGLFVAVSSVATTAAVATSPDGITWTARTAPNTNGWQSVCWSREKSLFVAVSKALSTSAVMTSPDGVTWTARTTPANGWLSVCWSPELGLFVAVSNGGTNRVMTSPDGITWTSRTSAVETNAWFDVCWAAELGLFVAVGSGTVAGAMTSPDGITWTSRASLTASSGFAAVCWSKELGLLVTSTGPTVAVSSDGSTWSNKSGISTVSVANGHSLLWCPELRLFVAMSSNGGSTAKAMTSPDGTNWTARGTAVDANSWQGVAWSPQLGLLAAVSTSTTAAGAMQSWAP